MGFVDWCGNAKIYGTDRAIANKCKSLYGFSCRKCGQKFGNGTIGIGSGYTKFCLKCYKEVFNNIRAEFLDFMKQMEATEKDIELNKEQYNAHNLACAI